MNGTKQATTKNKVIYGAGEYEGDFTGTTVGSIREITTDILNIDPEAQALINGIEVPDDYKVQTGEQVEFVKEAGDKG